MSKSRLVTSFHRYRDTDLEIKARFIVQSMDGNENFTTPIPALSTVSNAINTYVIALRDAESGGKTAVATKNEERAALEMLLVKLSLYVEATANYNEVVLLSSGFNLAKDPMPVGTLPKPHDFSATPTEKGAMLLKLSPIHRAINYQYEYRLANSNDPWNQQLHTKSKLKIWGLQSGVAYEFRVTAIGTDPHRVYSDIISSFVI